MERIEINPNKMGGKPVIKGTRVTVERILELLELGYSQEEIARELDIRIEDVKAAIHFAREWLSGEEILAQTTG